MIQLNQNPMENSAVSLNLNFRDSFGKYYIPTHVTYTLLALNSDKTTWSVVDGLYKKSLEPQSVICLTIPNMKLISETTPQRKIVVEWNAKIDGEFIDMSDEVQFCVQSRPYITNKPSEPLPYEVTLKLTSINLQVGSPKSAPIRPIVLFETNLPTKIDDATFILSDGENTLKCECTKDETSTKFRVSVDRYLERETDYTLTINGLVATNGIEQTDAFEFSFKTTDERSYEDINKDITKHNEEFEVIKTRLDDTDEANESKFTEIDERFETVTSDFNENVEALHSEIDDLTNEIESLGETTIINFDSWD